MGAGRGRRTGLLLIVVIIVLLVGGGAAILLLANPTGGPPASTEPTAVPAPTTVQLIVAARDITRGTRMAASDVTTIAWPIDLALPPGGMTAGDGVTQPGTEQVENRVARVDILAGQPVQEFMLTSADQATTLQQGGSDAALLIPSGQVAIAVPMSRLAGVAYALRAGDHVDIVVSYRFVDVDEEFQTRLPNGVGGILLPAGVTTQGTLDIAGRGEDGPFAGSTIVVIPSELSPRPRQTTQLMIDNAIVLRVGDWSLTDTEVVVATPPPAEATPAPEGEAAAAAPTPRPPAVPDVLTLVMSRQDALVLKFTLEVGADIDFALRSALDNNVTDVTTENVNLQYLLDFYNLSEPPALPIALDPRTDAFSNDPTGQFPHVGDVPEIFTFPPVTPAP